MSKVLNLSWQTIHDAVDALAYTIEKHKPRIIVGVARGGLIPATLLSHKLGIRLEVIKASAYEGTRRTLQKPIVVEGWKDFYNSERTMIVDDILDSGDTLQAIEAKISGIRYFKFASLFSKQFGEDHFYFGRVEPDIWVKFPWEGNEA